MKNNISKNYVNEKNVRLVAGQVVLFTVLLLLTNWKIITLLLVVDFALRAFTKIPSLFALNAKGISRTFNLTPKPIFAPPKRFAALLGLLFSIAIVLFQYLDFTIGVYVAGGVLVLCAALEAFLNICLGCYVFNLIIAPLSKIKGV